MATKSNVAAGIKRNMAAASLDTLDEIENDFPAEVPAGPISFSNYIVKQIPFNLLEVNRFQNLLRPTNAKKDKEEERLIELALNMTNNGFTSMILVRPHPQKPGYYELGYGHRRLQALKLAANLDIEPNKVKGWGKIPARIAETATDSEWLDIAVSENLSREDLSPLAIANSFEAIRSQNPGISLADIARRVGRSKSWVQRYDAINGAPDYLINLIEEKPDSVEHLFNLKRITNPNQQRELAQQVLRGELTLAALKELVDIGKPPAKNSKAAAKPNNTNKDTSLPNGTRLDRLITQLDINIQYLNQQLERESFYVGFEQHDKIENLVNNLKEVLASTRPRSKNK